MIHVTHDEDDKKLIDGFIKDYDDGDAEIALPTEDLAKLDKPVLMYIISRLLAK